MINKAVKLLRQYHDYSILEVSNLLEIDSSIIRKLESGEKPLTHEVLSKYSNGFDIPISALIFISESANRKSQKSNFSVRLKEQVADKALKIMEWVVEKENKSKA
jgi:transcriptional regulator with XRE-family HTH domain